MLVPSGPFSPFECDDLNVKKEKREEGRGVGSFAKLTVRSWARGGNDKKCVLFRCF